MGLFSIGNTIIKSVFRKPATVLFPIVPMKTDELVRGQVAIDIDECIFCGMCHRKCPTNAIEVTRDEKKWAISRSRCILCTNCVEVCPKKCLEMKNRLAPASFEKIQDSFQLKEEK